MGVGPAPALRLRSPGQGGLRGVPQDGAAQRQVLVGRVLRPVMADAADAGANSIADGITVASTCASCPAPLGIACHAPGACRSAAASSAAISAGSHEGGDGAAHHLERRPGSARGGCSRPPGRAGRLPAVPAPPTSTSRNWNSTSARPGMMEGAPGSSLICPVVQVVRSPTTAGKAASIAASRRTAVSPASRRSAMLVPPAWSCMPSMVMRNCQMATIPVTTAARLCGALQQGALLDVQLEVAAVAARLHARGAAGLPARRPRARPAAGSRRCGCARGPSRRP